MNPPYLKTAGDLDILIDDADLERASACMEGIGLQRLDLGPAWLQKMESHHVIFLPAASIPDGCIVELHFRLILQDAPISGQDFLKRSRAWSGNNGLQVRVLHPVDEALFLAIHSTRHSFSRLSWLLDALTVFRTLSDEERRQLVATAKESGQLVKLALANQAAKEFFKEPLIPELSKVAPWLPTLAGVQREAEWAAKPVQDSVPWRELWYRRLELRWYQCRIAGSPRNLLNVALLLFFLPLLRRARLLFR